MEFPLSLNKVHESEPIKERSESISIPALEIMAENIKNHSDIDRFLETANIFIAAESILDSNTKKKLHKKFTNDILRPELEKHLKSLVDRFNNLQSLIEKLSTNSLTKQDKKEMRRYSFEESLEHLKKEINKLAQIGLDSKELVVQIEELEKITQTKEYRDNEYKIKFPDGE